MSRSRWIAAAVILCVLAGTAVWLVWSDRGTYGHDLESYSGDEGEANRVVNLPDDQAQLAIGSPDGHDIVVQWRAPDGDGWTEPETVWTDEENLAVDNTVRYGGGTVAVLQVFTSDVHSDSDIDSVTVGIVCRDLVCSAREVPAYGGDAQVTPDGSTVYLAQDRKGAWLWNAADDIYRARWSGHPGFRYGVDSPSEPVLAPDGSLRIVTSEPSQGSCAFELLTSEPLAADLTSSATSTQQLRGRSESECRSYLDTFSADWVTVHPDDHRAPDFWFVRDGSTWTTSTEDPSGLEIIDVGRRCCGSSIAGFVHWNDVTFGSPDGHRIQVQTHLLGDETWSDPEILDGAPKGYRCSWQEGYEVGPAGFAVLMQCRSATDDAYAVAATPDLSSWDATFVADVAGEPEVSSDKLTVGGTTWTPDGGFVTD